jgi:hypothetical protein
MEFCGDVFFKVKYRPFWMDVTWIVVEDILPVIILPVKLYWLDIGGPQCLLVHTNMYDVVIRVKELVELLNSLQCH